MLKDYWLQKGIVKNPSLYQFSAIGVAPSVGGGLGTRPSADWPDILTTPPDAAATGRKCKFG